MDGAFDSFTGGAVFLCIEFDSKVRKLCAYILAEVPGIFANAGGEDESIE